MIEIPEAIVIAGQINRTITGKTVKRVIANASPHKFAWFHEDPDGYKTRLSKITAGAPCAYCGGVVKKEAYMGGSIYYRERCQER